MLIEIYVQPSLSAAAAKVKQTNRQTNKTKQTNNDSKKTKAQTNFVADALELIWLTHLLTKTCG